MPETQRRRRVLDLALWAMVAIIAATLYLS
jgi:predicted nicotinamide N-methyase